jgi:hypothetical protein
MFLRVVSAACLALAACSSSHAPAKHTPSGKAKPASQGGKADAGAGTRNVGPAGSAVSDAGIGSDGSPSDAASPNDGASSDAGTMGSDAARADAGMDAGGSGSEACGTMMLASSLETVTKPGNVLILWDRSTSMDEAWNNKPKWQAAGDALMSALAPLADQLTIGAVLFPSPDPSAQGVDCTVHPVTAPDELNFMPGPQALKALMGSTGGADAGCSLSPLYSSVSNCNIGATPTTEAVQQANTTLVGATLSGTTVALLVTDGEPNCNWDQSMTTTTLASWVSQWGVKTYVVGLPGTSGSNAMMVLDALAKAGGTSYTAPSDATALQQMITGMIGTALSSGLVSCSIDLTPAATPSDDVQLVVEEKALPGMREQVPHDLGAAGGWMISADGSSVALVGSVCSAAKNGLFSALSFERGCKDLPQLPASHVP